MLRISNLLFSVSIISIIILFSANSSSISSIYAQDTQYYSNNTNENNNSSLLNELENIKNILESKVTKLATALQIASNLPEILQPPDKNLIDSKINGIPEDADIEKRKIAKILLDQFNEFSSIDFWLNNGDIYFDEPFERQLNLTTNNLYLEIITKSFNLHNNTRLVVIDKNGVKIGDSNENETSISKGSFETKEQFLNLTSVKFALEGKSGTILEKFDGKESQITFLPYDIFQNIRILLLIQSCNSDGNESNKYIENNKEINLFNEIIVTKLSIVF